MADNDDNQLREYRYTGNGGIETTAMLTAEMAERLGATPVDDTTGDGDGGDTTTTDTTDTTKSRTTRNKARTSSGDA